jgi:hypothetical protein
VGYSGLGKDDLLIMKPDKTTPTTDKREDGTALPDQGVSFPVERDDDSALDSADPVIHFAERTLGFGDAPIKFPAKFSVSITEHGLIIS